jgi:hypothetical protein
MKLMKAFGVVVSFLFAAFVFLFIALCFIRSVDDVKADRELQAQIQRDHEEIQRREQNDPEK